VKGDEQVGSTRKKERKKTTRMTIPTTIGSLMKKNFDLQEAPSP
jgi:hypothetical protein